MGSRVHKEIDKMLESIKFFINEYHERIGNSKKNSAS